MRNIATARLERLTKRPEYLRVARGRRKAVTPGLVLQAAPLGATAVGQGPRVGFTASRKVGNAIARNRARRRLKAVARDVLSEHSGEPVDYVLIARAATVARGYDDLLNDLRLALRRVGQTGKTRTRESRS